MDKTYFCTLFNYTFWANRQVWDCVMTLTDAQFDEPLDYSVGSIHVQCVHMMAVEYWWPYFIQHGAMPPDMDALEVLAESGSREAIRARWDTVEQGVLAYLETLTPDELQRTVKPPHWDDQDRPVRVWEALLQVSNHSTDHRAQILYGLYRLGAETVGQDYLRFTDVSPLPPVE